MGNEGSVLIEAGVPALAALVGLGILGLWTHSYFAPTGVKPRSFEVARPSPAAKRPAGSPASYVPPPSPVSQTSAPSSAPPPLVAGSWPCFRGRDHDNIAKDGKLPSSTKGLSMIWTVPLGEGYAAPAVENSRVFVMDYDEAGKQDMLRCFALADGKELWRTGYPCEVKRYHGMSRTIPATDGRLVVAMTPKCLVVCADANTGQTKWTVDLVQAYGTKVPEWYAGQCPLLEEGKVILAPAGSSLLVALDAKTGKTVWKAPNPRGWTMTHSSIAPAVLNGERQYVYCGSGGVAGVSAKDGRILWDTEEWVVSTATVPTPVPIDGQRIFLCGGYNAGAMMLGVSKQGAKALWKVGTDVFGSEQQTPILYKGYLYGVESGGELVCLGLDGKRIWSSGSEGRFGGGPYLIADGRIVLLNDSGALTLAVADTKGYRPLGKIRVLQGRESWGPMALVGNRLLVRDSTTMTCIGLVG